MLAVALIAVAVAYLLGLWLLRSAHSQQIAQWALWRRDVMTERESWQQERRELLNRIQKPEFLPQPPVAHFEVPDSEPDGSELVGTVSHDEKDVGDQVAG